MKKFYEIALMQHVHGDVDNDYETVFYDYDWGCGYRTCRKYAKEYSKYIGEVKVPNVSYVFKRRLPEKYVQELDEGLAAVKIVCYTQTDFSDYEPLYYEYYKGGELDYKYIFDDTFLV